MRHVVVVDGNGWKRRYLIRDNDSDETAAQTGIPDGPPDLASVIDFSGLLKQTNNLFADAGVFSWEDVQRKPEVIQAAMTLYKRYLLEAFRTSVRVRKSTSGRKSSKESV